MLASKVGVESCTRITSEVGVSRGAVVGGLCLCKGYVDKVYLVFRFPSCFIIFESHFVLPFLTS